LGDLDKETKMKFILAFALVGAVALAEPIPSPTTVTLTGVGNALVDNSTNAYVGPYTLKFNGQQYDVMCVDFNDESHINDSWMANFTNLNPATASFADTYQSGASNPGKIYDEEAYLYNMLTHTTDATTRIDIQHAAWYLTDNAFSLDSGAQAELTIAQNNFLNPNFQATLANYYVISDVNTGSGREQEFLVSATPEPGSLGILAVGLLGLTGLVKRARRRATGESQAT